MTGIEGGQLRCCERVDHALAIGQRSHIGWTIQHRNAVAGDLHRHPKDVGAVLERILQGRDGVFGTVAGAAAVAAIRIEAMTTIEE